MNYGVFGSEQDAVPFAAVQAVEEGFSTAAGPHFDALCDVAVVVEEQDAHFAIDDMK